MSIFVLDPHFPHRIERALCNVAARRNAAAQLSNSARLLVAELLRVVCAKDPRQPVRVSNVTLEDALDMSARTIHRIKAELESAGWITRHQIQSRRLGMQISDVTFTEKALIALELIKPKIKKSNSPSQYNFPNDLKILVSLGVKPWCIFALMKLARKYKARLGDIIACIKDKLSSAKNIYGYIKAVILRGAGRDWEVFRSYKQAKEAECAQKADQTQAQSEEIALDAEKKINFGLTIAQLLELKKSMPQNKEFGLLDDLSVKFKHEGDGFYCYKNSTRIWGRITSASKLYQLFQEGKLQPIK